MQARDQLKPFARLTAWTLLALGAMPALGHANAEAVAAAFHPTSVVLEVADLEERQRLTEDFEGLVAKYGEFFAYLPLDQLMSVELRAGTFELRFDFGSKAEAKILTPASENLVVHRGKLKKTVTDTRTLLVRDRVRFTFSGSELTGIRKGDLRGKTGLASYSLKVRTETRAGKVVRDDKGRTVVALDAAGRPRTEDGRYVALTSDHWVILSAFGWRFELPAS
jgi:hypothetical protein